MQITIRLVASFATDFFFAVDCLNCTVILFFNSFVFYGLDKINDSFKKRKKNPHETRSKCSLTFFKKTLMHLLFWFGAMGVSLLAFLKNARIYAMR